VKDSIEDRGIFVNFLYGALLTSILFYNLENIVYSCFCLCVCVYCYFSSPLQHLRHIFISDCSDPPPQQSTDLRRGTYLVREMPTPGWRTPQEASRVARDAHRVQSTVQYPDAPTPATQAQPPGALRHAFRRHWSASPPVLGQQVDFRPSSRRHPRSPIHQQHWCSKILCQRQAVNRHLRCRHLPQTQPRRYEAEHSFSAGYSQVVEQHTSWGEPPPSVCRRVAQAGRIQMATSAAQKPAHCPQPTAAAEALRRLARLPSHRLGVMVLHRLHPRVLQPPSQPSQRRCVRQARRRRPASHTTQTSDVRTCVWRPHNVRARGSNLRRSSTSRQQQNIPRRCPPRAGQGYQKDLRRQWRNQLAVAAGWRPCTLRQRNYTRAGPTVPSQRAVLLLAEGVLARLISRPQSHRVCLASPPDGSRLQRGRAWQQDRVPSPRHQVLQRVPSCCMPQAHALDAPPTRSLHQGSILHHEVLIRSSTQCVQMCVCVTMVCKVCQTVCTMLQGVCEHRRQVEHV